MCDTTVSCLLRRIHVGLHAPYEHQYVGQQGISSIQPFRFRIPALVFRGQHYFCFLLELGGLYNRRCKVLRESETKKCSTTIHSLKVCNSSEGNSNEGKVYYIVLLTKEAQDQDKNPQ